MLDADLFTETTGSFVHLSQGAKAGFRLLVAVGGSAASQRRTRLV